MNKGLNMQSVKNENRSLILYLLNSKGAMSRKELSARLSLTPAAVTKICSELIEKGLVREAGEAQEKIRSGRKEILLTLCLEDKLAFGVNAERDNITFSVTNLKGSALTLRSIPFCDDAVEVAKIAADFLDELGALRENIIGAGICIIGTQKEDDFGIWKEDNLAGIFEDALGMPVVVENNVKAFALSEMIFGNADINSSLLFLKWGPGVGSAIVANGKVFSGNDSSVTEIGHYIVNPGGKKCRCGRFGCLETEVSEDAIQKELNDSRTLKEVLQNPTNDDINILEHKIDLVALVLTNTATILNTNNIVLFGTMFSNRKIADKLKKQCLRYNTNLSDDTVRLSALNVKSSYIGAAAICAKRFFFEKSV